MKPPARVPQLHLFATLWSLRQYPTEEAELPMDAKIHRVSDAGFAGIMSPPVRELGNRGSLAYWGITSLGETGDVAPALAKIAELSPRLLTVQLCDVDSPLEHAVAVSVEIMSRANEFGTPAAIEIHRDTFTETPEKTLDLMAAYQAKTGAALPICADHSHFAVVRHLRPPYWDVLGGQTAINQSCNQIHFRPFNGHHCQIPATNPDGTRSPEYLPWLDYARAFLRELHRQGREDIFAVPELGHANPSYRLSCFPDTWRDVLVVKADLERIWHEIEALASGGK